MKERIMAAQLVFGLIIFLVSYVGTTVLLIETLMWAMGRLDRPKAPAATPRWALESRLASTLSVQADLGPHVSVRKLCKKYHRSGSIWLSSDISSSFPIPRPGGETCPSTMGSL